MKALYALLLASIVALHPVYARGAAISAPGTGGGAEADTLDTVFDRGKEIDGANSEANAIIDGDGTNKMKRWWDPTYGYMQKPDPLGNSAWRCWTNFGCVIKDWENSDATMFTIDPDATDNDKYVWASGYRPIKTLALPADALYPRGGSTLVTDTELISGGLIAPYVTTTDSDNDGFYRYVVMPSNWDGGTVTATVTLVNTNGTPGNAFVGHVSGACYPVGTVVATTISTTGEQSATFTFSSACGGGACHQNDPVQATTAAITINGTPAGGNYCGFQFQTDATGTTETVGGIKVVSMHIHYKIAQGF